MGINEWTWGTRRFFIDQSRISLRNIVVQSDQIILRWKRGFSPDDLTVGSPDSHERYSGRKE